MHENLFTRFSISVFADKYVNKVALPASITAV